MKEGFEPLLIAKMSRKRIDISFLSIATPGWIDQIINAEPDQFFRFRINSVEQARLPLWGQRDDVKRKQILRQRMCVFRS